MGDTSGGAERIFISYSTKDGKKYADLLRKELIEKGFSVWQDLVALEPGPDWMSQIETAIRSDALEHFILVVTPGAIKSHVVRNEIRLARQEGKTFLPVKGPGIENLQNLPRLFGQVADLSIPERKTQLYQILEGPSRENRVPMMAPEPPEDFVARPKEFGALKKMLLDEKGLDAVAITAALKGAGGYGKTTLAKALAHDDKVQDAYFDGVLWVELGEQPDNLISPIADLIETLTGKRPGLETLTAASNALDEALGNRRILLIIDDVWRAQDLTPFMKGGPHTTRLVTTRLDNVLPAKTHKRAVDAMAMNEAVSLLSWGLPEEAELLYDELESLAKHLGEWALLLKLVNGVLADNTGLGLSVADAIKEANMYLLEEGFLAFDSDQADDNDRSQAVSKTIAVSLRRLSEDEQKRFQELCIFPEDEDIPLGVIQNYWTKTSSMSMPKSRMLLTKLKNLSLLLNLDLKQNTARLHDTIRHYLIACAGEGLSHYHESFVEVLSDQNYREKSTIRDQAYRYTFFPMHLHEARKNDELASLLLSPIWLNAKLNATKDPQSLIVDYDAYGTTQSHTRIGQTLRLAAGILARDPNQILPQLSGRLMTLTENSEPDPDLSALISYVPETMPKPCLVTKRPSLTPPGAELQRLEGHTDWVNSIIQLSDKRLASASNDGTIRLWNVDTGAQTTLVKCTEMGLNCLVQLSDDQLACSGSDHNIYIWNLKTGAQEAVLKGHDDEINSLIKLSNGNIASGSSDNTIRFWNAEKAEQTTILSGHTDTVTGLIQLKDGRLASCSHDKTIRLWDSKTGKQLAVLEGHVDRVNCLLQLTDGSLISASRDNSIRSWDLKNEVQITVLNDIWGDCQALVELNGGHVASIIYHTIRVWDIGSGDPVAMLEGHTGGVETFLLLANGYLASGGTDCTIRFWDVETGMQSIWARTHTMIGSLTQLADGCLVSGSFGDISLWDAKTGEELTKLSDHTGWVTGLAQLHNGLLASASGNTIRIHNIETGKLVTTWELAEENETVETLIQLTDGRLALGFRDNVIRIQDVETGALEVELEGHSGWITALTELAGGLLASGSTDGTISFWDVSAGTQVAMLRGHAATVCSLVQLSDQQLASGSFDSTIRLWNVKTGAQTAILEGHAFSVYSLTQLSDGRLASASFDRTIRLWDLETAKQLCCLEVDAPVEALCLWEKHGLAAGDALGRMHWLEVLD